MSLFVVCNFHFHRGKLNQLTNNRLSIASIGPSQPKILYLDFSWNFSLSKPWIIQLTLETATTRGFIQNPGSQDHLLTSLVDALLSTHKPSAAKATATDPLGGGNWEAEESEEEAAEPVWAKSTHEEASCDVLAFVAGEEEMGTIKHDKHERNDWQAILRVQQLLSRRRGRFLGVPPQSQPTSGKQLRPSLGTAEVQPLARRASRAIQEVQAQKDELEELGAPDKSGPFLASKVVAKRPVEAWCGPQSCVVEATWQRLATTWPFWNRSLWSLEMDYPNKEKHLAGDSASLWRFWDGEFTWPEIKGWKGDLQLSRGSSLVTPWITWYKNSNFEELFFQTKQTSAT